MKINWYLHVNLPHWKSAAYYPVLIYSWDIVTISKTIEKLYGQTQNVDELFSILNETLDTNNKSIDRELLIPYNTFPYYEGMNRMGLDQYWLGLYWRNNRYDLKFLKDFCGFCLDNSIGKICITPWKSFIVKGIKKESRPALERFLGQWGINVRHSQLEMNWHLPVDDEEALELKKFLVRSFDQNDISTYGLTFGISNDVGKRSHFSSVVIEKNSPPAIVKNYAVRPTYNVLHFENFDPNTNSYTAHAQDVDKIELPGLLMELSKKYFEQLGQEKEKKRPPKNLVQKESREVYQCNHCYTVYDEELGDVMNGIVAGTSFEKLPSTYQCPVCESVKEDFTQTEIQLA